LGFSVEKLCHPIIPLYDERMQAQLLSAIAPRPFLKWAGGKGQLISQYIPHFPTGFSTYYEPFLGGGAIFFHLLPPQSLLLDINPELVNVFECIRDHVDEVIVQLAEHRDRHCQDYYYQVRAHIPEHPLERAARLVYLNKTCFNGLYRENSKGLFNVPMGSYKKPCICDPGLLYAASSALQTARIALQPFEGILEHATTRHDFVYFDPPYYPISATSKFTAYNRYAFTAADQIRLRDVFRELRDRGVKVMLSNSDCPFIRDLYQDFTIHTISASRSINSNAEKRGKITEVLVTSY
jgi:DNA adenine methylase